LPSVATKSWSDIAKCVGSVPSNPRRGRWRGSALPGIIDVVRRLLVPLLVAAGMTSAAAAALALPARPIEDRPRVLLKNGLYGTVYRSPSTPVCTLIEPCEAPAPNVTLVFTRPGAAVIRVRTSHDGRYRVLLPAAIYRVSTPGAGLPQRNAPFPERVKVRRRHIDKLDFRIDTGIR
jgi:hypothetical protein